MVEVSGCECGCGLYVECWFSEHGFDWLETGVEHGCDWLNMVEDGFDWSDAGVSFYDWLDAGVSFCDWSDAVVSFCGWNVVHGEVGVTGGGGHVTEVCPAMTTAPGDVVEVWLRNSGVELMMNLEVHHFATYVMVVLSSYLARCVVHTLDLNVHLVSDNYFLVSLHH